MNLTRDNQPPTLWKATILQNMPRQYGYQSLNLVTDKIKGSFQELGLSYAVTVRANR